MHIDCRRESLTSFLAARSFDLCIAGAGPAGMALAMALETSGLRILLLDSGGMRRRRDADALNDGEIAAGSRHCPAQLYRVRAVGGASALWGGRCMPLDPVDFIARPWLGLEQPWPITHSELIPFWQRAQALVEAGPYAYAGEDVPGGLAPILAGFSSPDITMQSVERFSPPTRFGARYGAQLAASAHITLATGTTVVEVLPSASGGAVRALLVASADGTRHRVIARAFVLALGGIETPRLLLASRTLSPEGLGNASGQLGRNYMCHLAGVTGRFTPAPGVRVARGYGRGADGVYCRRRFALTPAAQARVRAGNAIIRLHHPDLADAAHGSGAMSAVYLARFLLAPEYRIRLGEGGRIAPHLANIAASPGQVAGFAWQMLRARVLARRKFPSLMLEPPAGEYALDVHAEQLPNPASRITLSARSDRLGLPLPLIDWRYLPADIATIRSTLTVFQTALATHGAGRVRLEHDRLEADMLREGAYGGHHLGTARMSERARDGVVNPDCRVHGLANLFIAGGAVFPTSGQANPTLTIVALALRLAEHLGGALAKGGPLCPGLRAGLSPISVLTT